MGEGNGEGREPRRMDERRMGGQQLRLEDGRVANKVDTWYFNPPYPKVPLPNKPVLGAVASYGSSRRTTV